MQLEKYKDYLNLTDKDIENIKKAKAAVRIDLRFLIITGIAGFAFFSSFTTQSLLFKIIAGAFTFIFGFLTVSKYIKATTHYNNTVKEIVIENMFKKEFDNVIYNPTKGFDKKYIDSLEIIAKGNTYNSNDLLSASYKGVGFMQADVDIKEVTSNGKTTTTVEYFKGRWIVLDFIKNFEGYHQVRSNGSFFKNKKPGKFFGTPVSKIQFESVEFNKFFTSYTNNEAEAFYLITPNMMQKMTDFKNYVGCEVIYGFINNKLHIAIYNGENAFEVKGRDITKEFIDNINYDMGLIKMVVDELDLDVDIFK